MLKQRLSTGIVGLDQIMCGGLLPEQSYLVRGMPGCGKTIIGLHILIAAHQQKKIPLYITLEEPAKQLKRNASTLGFDLNSINFLDLSPTSDFFTKIETYDIFAPAEVEREPLTQKIIEAIEALQPNLVFIDSITQFRYLANDNYGFRKQVLAFLRFLGEKNATVIFTSESNQEQPDNDLQFMADCVINLSFFEDERTINISKFRGSDFHQGKHSLNITSTGIEVFPRLIPKQYKQDFLQETIPSGIPELDELLFGGIERGSVTLFTGPTGVGKTTLGIQFMKEAAGRGERSVVYSFEEDTETLIRRCQGINIPIHAMVDRGTLSIIKIDPLLYTPDQFANLVREDVEERNTQIVMIDSISGYRLSIRGEDLVRHLHAVCQYLKNIGITVILINEIETITGDFRATELGISYLADNIVILRYLEIKGEIRKAIGVLKKRLTDFEKTLREMEITRYGVKVGKPLTNLRRILSGTPEFIDS